MTDRQLAVLLAQVRNRIEIQADVIEGQLIAKGWSKEDSLDLTLGLRTVTYEIRYQIQDLNKGP